MPSPRPTVRPLAPPQVITDVEVVTIIVLLAAILFAIRAYKNGQIRAEREELRTVRHWNECFEIQNG